MKLSLIVTTKNRARYFERALAALIREKREGYPHIEIVITDAGSTDGTVDIIRKNEAHIDKWLSKPDSGVSEGANRAFALATGDVIWGTGDDDIIVPGASLKMMAYLKDHPEVDAVFGHNKLFFDELDGSSHESSWRLPYTVGRVTKRTLCRLSYADFILPEAGFYRKRVVDLVGGYDLKLHYMAFWDFLFRLHAAGVTMEVIPEVVIHTHQTPLSDTRSAIGTERFTQECLRVAYHHGGPYWWLWHRFKGDLSIANLSAALRRQLGSTLHVHPRKWRDAVLRRLRLGR